LAFGRNDGFVADFVGGGVTLEKNVFIRVDWDCGIGYNASKCTGESEMVVAEGKEEGS
jgi:hypothetical protein